MGRLTLPQRRLLVVGNAGTGTVSRTGLKTSDSFTRADSALSLGTTDCAFGGDPLAWTALAGTWGISTNRAYNPSAAAPGYAYVDTTIANCMIECTFTSVAADFGLIWRTVDASNQFVCNTNQAFRVQGGGFNAVGPTFNTALGRGLVAGDTLTIILSGSTHTLAVGAITIASFTDAFQATATKHGLRSDSAATNFFDNFKVSFN